MPIHISKDTFIKILLLMFIGLAVRLIHFEHTTFGYDQARDGFMALEIFGKDPIKLIGPSTDIGGLFHGSLYWYIISPAYFLSQGNPLPVKLYHTLLQLGMIPLSYFIALRLTQKKEYAFMTALLMTFSIEAVQYSRWMSNPSFALFSVSLFFFGLWEVLNKKTYGLGLMMLMWAFCVQLQLFLIYLFPFLCYAMWKVIRDRGIKNLFSPFNIAMAICAGLLFMPFLASEVKFNLQGTRSLLGYLTGNSLAEGPSFIQKMFKFAGSLSKNVFYNILGIHKSLAHLLTISGVSYIVYSIIKRQSLYKEKYFFLYGFVHQLLSIPLRVIIHIFLTLGILFHFLFSP